MQPHKFFRVYMSSGLQNLRSSMHLELAMVVQWLRRCAAELNYVGSILSTAVAFQVKTKSEDASVLRFQRTLQIRR